MTSAHDWDDDDDETVESMLEIPMDSPTPEPVEPCVDLKTSAPHTKESDLACVQRSLRRKQVSKRRKSDRSHNNNNNTKYARGRGDRSHQSYTANRRYTIYNNRNDNQRNNHCRSDWSTNATQPPVPTGHQLPTYRYTSSQTGYQKSRTNAVQPPVSNGQPLTYQYTSNQTTLNNIAEQLYVFETRLLMSIQAHIRTHNGEIIKAIRSSLNQ